jgi:tetratricopeptide (TPR) repeat protein
MFNRKVLKWTAVSVLFLFTWFCFVPDLQAAQEPKTPASKLERGRQSFDIGDYETSIRLLEEYTADITNPREKRAEAFYFLAKNYYAVDPPRVKEMLLKVFETDGFFNFDEKDIYFTAELEAARQEFTANIPADRYLEEAEAAFEKGKYDEARYLYRVVLLKLPGKTFEKQVERCTEVQNKKFKALEQYKKKDYPQAYMALKELLMVSPDDEDVKKVIEQIEVQNIRPMIEAGDGYFDSKNYKAALPFYKEVLTLVPGNRDVQEKLSVCREMLAKEAAANNSIVKEAVKKKKKKKFPILPVLLGIAVVVAAYFLFIKKKKEPKTGTVNVRSTPTEAAIYLDGHSTGLVTNATLVDVSPGSHTVKLVKERYIDYEVTITVEAGKETVISASLTERPQPNFVTNTDVVVVPEGGKNTFQVKLSENPFSDVTATVSWVSGDSDISIESGETLTFTAANYSNYQAVTLKAAADEDIVNGEAIIRVSATGIPDKEITATEQDFGSSGELYVSPKDNFSSTGSVGGPFSPASKTYILQNIGNGSINWTASSSESWVSLSSTGGALSSSSSTTVVVSVNANANTLIEGTYSDTVLFINTTNGAGTTTRTVSLVISSADVSDPTVSFQSPSDGDTVSGTVSIQVTASDDQGIDYVEIYIDDILGGTLTTSPYNYNWDTTSVSDGIHSIKAVAYDTAAKKAEAEINVTVANGGT